MSVSCTVSEIFSVKEWRDLETGVGVVQSHWKFLIDYIRLFIGLPLYIYSSIWYRFLSYVTLKNSDLEIWVTGH